MKKIEAFDNSSIAEVQIDTRLDKYRDKTLFPEKLEKANEMLAGTKLPVKKHAAK